MVLDGRDPVMVFQYHAVALLSALWCLYCSNNILHTDIHKLFDMEYIVLLIHGYTQLQMDTLRMMEWLFTRVRGCKNCYTLLLRALYYFRGMTVDRQNWNDSVIYRLCRDRLCDVGVQYITCSMVTFLGVGGSGPNHHVYSPLYYYIWRTCTWVRTCSYIMICECFVHHSMSIPFRCSM